MTKKYYKIQFELLEPLSLGSGENKFSDSDILRDSRGMPFIPGSSLCGAYRKCFNDQDANQYFGELIDPSKKRDGDESSGTNKISSVIVYDATFTGDSCNTEIRDSVGLDDYKVANEGAKFDFELIQPGAVFETYIEQNMKDDDLDVGDIIAQKMYAGEFYLGHKSMRGYGKVKATNIWHRTFVLPDFNDGISDNGLCENDLKQLDEWLLFDMYNQEGFKDKVDVKEQNKKNQDQIQIELKLKQQGGISIRRYTTELTKDEKNQPDYVQMHYIKGKDNTGKDDKEKAEIPFIPGTTWSGAFRHHIKKLLTKELPEKRIDNIIEQYFGYSRNKEKEKSKIRFSESIIKGAKPKIIMRNAIDRFTGGTIEGALYTEKSYFGGETVLTITMTKQNSKDDKIFQNALAASIADLNEGILSIGGLTAVGRGLFSIENCSYNNDSIYSSKDIDNNSKASEEIYKRLIKAMNDDDNGTGNQEEKE